MNKQSGFQQFANTNAFMALMIFVALMTLMLLGGQLWLSYRDQIRTAEISTLNLAALFEARLEATLRRTDADLATLALEIPEAAMHKSALPRFRKEVNANLDGRLFNMDEMAGYRVHDAEGDNLYSSDSKSTQLVNIADRVYFKRLRDNPEIGVLYSEVVVGRSTGKSVMVIARGVRDKQGRFLGIVHGMINLDYYRNQFESLDLGKQGLIALRRSDNHAMVVRYPYLPAQTNKPLAPDHPIAQRMVSGDRVMKIHYSASPDYVDRVASVVRMDGYPFYFAVGAGLDEVLAGWHKQVVVVVTSAFMMIVLVIGLMVRLRRLQFHQVKMLDDLMKSESQFRELTKLVPVGVCYFDRGGRCTYVNDRQMVITGRSREELLDRDWRLYVHPDDCSRFPEIWAKRAAPDSPFVCDFRFVRPDGHFTHVLAEVRAGIDDAGEVQGYIVALTDITERKKTEAELLVAKQRAESADLAKTRFLAAASHDLRQPIQAINLFQDALRRTGLSEEQKTICGFLARSVRSLGELLYSLLDISKLDAGQIKPQPRSIKVESLFSEIDAEFSTLARQKNLRFKLFYPFSGLTLWADPVLIMSVIRNLIDNALKYTETGGALVSARRRRDRMLIQVWDTGIGIDPRYGEQIFEECFQVGNSVRDRTKGLGLGLSIVRRMSILLGSEVVYRSMPGKGSVFEFFVPLDKESLFSDIPDWEAMSPIAEDHDQKKAMQLVGRRVVVIEDDPMVAKSIEISLEDMGVEVQVYVSAEQALADPDSLVADFYISDFNLPGVNGIAVLEAIQQRRSGAISAVLMTGETSPERIELTAASRWPVLFKPVEFTRLLEAMVDAARAR